jgi:general secretion pathway protein I
MARTLPRNAGQRGFTILEVLVAFVVFSVVIGLLMQLFIGGLRDAQLTNEYAHAVVIAQSQLAVATAEEHVLEGAHSGKEGEYEWTVELTPYDERKELAADQQGKDYNLRVQLMRAQSRVAWAAADRHDRNVRLSTLFLVTKP